MKVLYVETPTGYGGSMQSLLELIEYLPDEIEPVVAVPYDVGRYRAMPQAAAGNTVSSLATAAYTLTRESKLRRAILRTRCA